MQPSGLIEGLDDPVLVLDDDGRIRSCNGAGRRLFGDDGVVGDTVDAVFSPDEHLARRYADMLAHYRDVGAVIEGDRRHFDPEHATVRAVRERVDPREEDPDVGVFVDGDRRYFHLTTASAGRSDRRLLVFRDITRVKDHERDLDFLRQVLARILRHNLRNDLSVVRAYAESIAESDDADLARMAETIQRKADALVETSEKARLIEKAIENDRPMTFPLRSVVADCADAVRNEHGDVTVETDLPDADVAVRAVRTLPEALTDTIENAVVHGRSERVEVTATRDGAWVVLRVVDDGPGIPERELEALRRRGETDLVHASGAGLWLLATTVRESGGDVSFEADDGTTVRISLPAAR